MGPLIPNIIPEELNFFIALIVGLGFGFALEQAGFASTKKLVGLFYGYDFTVLRVFFTAGITAMTGIIILNHFNLLDLNVIYINPTFLWSALIGGAIMGLGFIIGGFCPGTSACAAATGRIDGWFFIGGSLLGIFAFTETYPIIKDLYLAESLGSITMFTILDISMELWGVIMLLIAFGAFIATQIIENKVNHKKTQWKKATIYKNSALIASPIFIVLIIMATPTRRELMNKRIDTKIAAGECNPKMIEADKLAFELMHQYYKYNVVDIRSKAEYDSFHIPTAINIPINDLHKQEYIRIISQNLKTNIFYGANPEESKRACMIAKYFGHSDNYSLDISAESFQQLFLYAKNLESDASKEDANLYLFRKDAWKKLKEIGDAISNMNAPVEQKARKVQGGCS